MNNVKTRYLFVFLLSALGIFLMSRPEEKLVGQAITSLSLFLLFPEIYIWSLIFALGGYPLREISIEEDFCMETRKHETCIYIGFELFDVRHNVNDLSEKRFWFYTQSFINTIITGNNTYFVVVDRGRYFIVTRMCTNRFDALPEKIKSEVYRLKRSFERHGLSFRPMGGSEVYRILRPDFIEKAKRNKFREIFLAILGSILFFKTPVLFPVSSALLLASFPGNLHGYRRKNSTELYTLDSIQSFYSYPSIFDIFSRAQLIYSISDKIFLLLRLTPGPLHVEHEIDSKAYRDYELGTALDKLSVIHSSAKFFAASRRRWERRESLYLVSGLLAATQNEVKILKTVGFIFKKSLLPLGVLE